MKLFKIQHHLEEILHKRADTIQFFLDEHCTLKLLFYFVFYHCGVK